jgi:hypothetical protein
MAVVARLGAIKIVQHQVDRSPPHFHIIRGDEEVTVLIADLTLETGSMKGGIPRDVMRWATIYQPDLALNWVRAVSGLRVERIPIP